MTIFRNKKLLTVIVAAVFLVLFYGFSRYVKNGGLKKFDFDVTVKLQERIDRSSKLRLADAIGNVFEGSTFFASPEVSVAALLILTAVLFLDRKSKKLRWSAFAIPMLFALLVGAEIYGKSVVHHPAPPFFMIKNPTTVFPKYYINESYSYPSGHAARAVFLSIVSLWAIALYFPERRKFFKIWIMAVSTALVYVVIVSTGRVYLGHHWASDIIGGGLLGAGMALLWSAFAPGERPGAQTKSD